LRNQTADKVTVQLEAFPRRLKPRRFDSLYGAAEAAPLQNGEFVIDLRPLHLKMSGLFFLMVDLIVFFQDSKKVLK